MLHKIRWDDLKFVLAVAEHGSLSAAARAVGVNHATVLRRIAALEAQFGIALFERPPGGYRIKPEAREILAAIETMGRTVDRLERVMPTIGSGLEGAFRLTTTDDIADLILPRYLRDLADLHPKLNVEVVVANNPIDMARGAAEITLRPALGLPEGLTGQRICDMAFRVYANRDYAAAHSGTDYSDHRWLGVAPPITRSPVGPWQDAGISNAIALRADSFLTLARMAEAGLGAAMLPSFVARRCEGLVRLPQFSDELQIGLWVATHPDLMHGERVATMINFFAQAIAQDAALLG